ncbi:hypothetical protein SDJN02_19283, partial [Cucurbita argyrosperma subsp. argyrosperma]
MAKTKLRNQLIKELCKYTKPSIFVFGFPLQIVCRDKESEGLKEDKDLLAFRHTFAGKREAMLSGTSLRAKLALPLE